MSIPGSASPLFFQTAAGDAAAFQIDRSLRFNSGDNAYLNRTPTSAGNQKTFTWSGWVKRTVLGADKFLFSAGSDPSNMHYLRFQSNNTLEATEKKGDSVQSSLITSAVYRDPSAWMHIIYVYDSSQATASDRLSLYVNGAKITSFGTSTYPSQNHDSYINSTSNHFINARPNPAAYSDFYLAEIQLLDGTAVSDASDFGEYDDNNVWQPINTSSLTFGTNGFRLKFDDNSSNSALGNDSSGNDNDWTVNNISATGSAWNQSQTWSSSLSSTTGFRGSEPATNAFDSNTSSICSAVNDGVVTFTSPVTFASDSTIRVIVHGGDHTVTVNGGSNQTISAGSYQTVTFTNSSNSTFTMTFQRDTSADTGIRAIEIGGNVLVDSSVVDPNAGDIDSLIDTPSNYTTDSGNNGGNYCTLNPLKNQSQTLKNGNLVSNGTSGRSTGTIYASSGKFYWEFTAGSDYTMAGIESSTSPQAASYSGENDQQYALYGNAGSGQLYHNGGITSFDGFVSGDIIGVALDMDGGNLYFYKNGSAMNSGNAAATGLTGAWTANCRSGSGSYNGDTVFNFGQRPFAYTPPTGYKSLCSTNLPDPAIADGSTAMDSTLWTGNGSSQTISGLSHSPDFIWHKIRSITGGSQLYDSVRGTYKRLRSDQGGAESTLGGVTAFNSDGWTMSAGNNNNESYVSWTWDAGSSTVSNTDGSITSSVRANQTAGFSIVTWSGNSQNATVGHGLGAVPELILHKRRNGSASWITYHKDVGNNRAMQFNSTDAFIQNSYFDNKSPTSTIFNVSDFDETNRSGSNYLAYCWAPVEGYSSFRSHTVSSGTNFVYLGFLPKLVILKRTATGSTTNMAYASWAMFDTKRDTFNEVDFDTILYANRDYPEGKRGNSPASTGGTYLNIDILSNGIRFQSGAAEFSQPSDEIIVMAWAEHPFKTARAR